MKILMVADDLSWIGGPRTNFLDMREQLLKLGHDVFCFYGNNSADDTKIIRPQDYVYSPKDFWFFSINPHIGYKTLSFIYRSKTLFDAVYFFGYSAPFFVYLSGLLRNVPTVYYFSGPWFLETKSQLAATRLSRKWLTLHVQKVVQERCLKAAHRIVVRGKYSLSVLRKHFNIHPKKVFYLPGAINVSTYYPLSQEQRNTQREKLGLNHKAKIFLCVARPEPRKGLDIVVQAMNIVRRKLPSGLLLIIFPSRSFVDYQYLIELYTMVDQYQLGGRVLFLTGLSGIQLAQYYQVADYFISASRDLETFGLTTIEALGCGTPVIGSKAGETKNILEPLNGSLLFETNNPMSLAKVMLTFSKLSPKRFQSLSQQCVQYVHQKYTWDKNLLLLEALFRFS